MPVVQETIKATLLDGTSKEGTKSEVITFLKTLTPNKSVKITKHANDCNFEGYRTTASSGIYFLSL